MVARMIFCTIGSVWQNWNGNRNVAYLNLNDSKRKLNLNYYDNDWNENCRFAAVRKLLYSPRSKSGSFCCNCFCQPPKIFPISFSIFESRMYFLASIVLISHDICRKNFNKSNFKDAR